MQGGEREEKEEKLGERRERKERKEGKRRGKGKGREWIGPPSVSLNFP